MGERHALGRSLRAELDSRPPKARRPPPGWKGSVLASVFRLLAPDF